jgi:hypothetical protein
LYAVENKMDYKQGKILEKIKETLDRYVDEDYRTMDFRETQLELRKLRDKINELFENENI